jgi:hypothetical protein
MENVTVRGNAITDLRLLTTLVLVEAATSALGPAHTAVSSDDAIVQFWKNLMVSA